MAVRSSERPTIAPAYDVEKFAAESERRMTQAVPSRAPEDELDEGSDPKRSEVRIATRPPWGPSLSTQAWARSVAGTPCVTMTNEALKRLPLDHRAGFLLSLMDGSLDLETIVELCGMESNEALELVRDLYESGVVVFR
jgi:hypothetical protein